jgi:uncharacterized protein YbjT (DUF2867 family)
MTPGQSPQPNIPPAAVNPLAIPLAELAAMLTKVSGRPVSVEQLRLDVANGAPATAVGRVNLVLYAAWLAREVQSK